MGLDFWIPSKPKANCHLKYRYLIVSLLFLLEKRPISLGEDTVTVETRRDPRFSRVMFADQDLIEASIPLLT